MDKTVIDSYPRYERYKDSGVDWLGEIPEEWLVYNSKWLFACRKEKARKNDKQLTASQKYGVIPQNLFMDLESRKVTTVFLNHEILKHVEKGDFVISMRSFQGGIEYCDYQGSVSSAYVPLIPNSTIYAPFYKFLLKSKKYIEALQVTSNLVRDGQALRYDNFCMVPLPLIPFKEQVAIANFLNEKTTQIDQAITLKQQQIAKFEEYKQIVIQNAVTKGLNPDAPMKDSGVDWIGDIPEHWEIKKIKGVAELNGRIGFRGYSTTDLVNKGEGSITLSPSNLLSGKMTFEKNSYLSWKKYYESPEIMVFNNDILLVKTGSTVGKVGIVKELDEEATINPQLLVFKKVRAHSDYLYYYLSTSTFFNTIKTSATGSTIPTISETKIKNLKIIYPPINEQIEIAKSISNTLVEINSLAKTHQTQINRLKEYKTILINQAVTGKIKVS